jgi:hypothetical protein
MSVWRSAGAHEPPGCSAYTMLWSRYLMQRFSGEQQRAATTLTRYAFQTCTLSSRPPRDRRPWARTPRCCVQQSRPPETLPFSSRGQEGGGWKVEGANLFRKRRLVIGGGGGRLLLGSTRRDKRTRSLSADMLPNASGWRGRGGREGGCDVDVVVALRGARSVMIRNVAANNIVATTATTTITSPPPSVTCTCMLMSVSALLMKCCTVSFSSTSCGAYQAADAAAGCKGAHHWQQRLPLRVPRANLSVVGAGAQPGDQHGQPSVWRVNAMVQGKRRWCCSRCVAPDKERRLKHARDERYGENSCGKRLDCGQRAQSLACQTAHYRAKRATTPRAACPGLRG